MLNLLYSIKNQYNADRRSKHYRELIRREAELGGTLFGPVPAGVRREFFCLNKHTWVWHEEWTNQEGLRQAITTTYNVKPDGILKVQDGQPYQYVDFEEGKRLYKAMQMYKDLAYSELYSVA